MVEFLLEQWIILQGSSIVYHFIPEIVDYSAGVIDSLPLYTCNSGFSTRSDRFSTWDRRFSRMVDFLLGIEDFLLKNCVNP